MKEYYLLKSSSDINEIGTYPQCQDFVKGTSKEDIELLYIAERAMKRNNLDDISKIHELSGLKIHGRAKVTDFICSNVPNVTIVNRRMIDILSKYSIGECILIPIKLKRRGVVWDYYCFYCRNDMNEYVDFSKSVFRMDSFMNLDGSEELPPFSNLQEIKDLREKALLDLKIINPQKILLKKDFPKGLDIFTLPNITRTAELFISSSLADRLVEEKITGIEIDRDIIAIAE